MGATPAVAPKESACTIYVTRNHPGAGTQTALVPRSESCHTIIPWKSDGNPIAKTFRTPSGALA